MNSDGSNQTQLTSGSATDFDPVFSPDGKRIAFTSTRNDPNPSCTLNCEYTIYVMDADGSDLTRVPISNAPDCWLGPRHTQPDWSPSGERIVFNWDAGADCGQELDTIPTRIETIRPDGTGQTILREELYGGWDTEPGWSPDGTRIVHTAPPTLGMRTIDSGDGSGPSPVTEGDSPDWQPLPVNTANGYPRPKGAAPVRVPLVPAFKPCTASNRTHGPPLAFSSCNPPQTESPNLTVSQGNARLRSSGLVRLDAIVGAPGPPDDSDIRITFSLTNVMKASDFADYGGDLRARLRVRLTDKDFQTIGATSMEFPFEFTVPCIPTPASTLDGSTCQVNTTAWALVPGVLKDGYRSILALDALQFFGGGADGDAETEADNKLFATQGIFVP
jgi:Tol biopolymer transport system component